MVASMDQSALPASRPRANGRSAILVLCSTALCVIICSYHRIDAKPSEAMIPAKGASRTKKAMCKALGRDGSVEKLLQRIDSKDTLEKYLNDLKNMKDWTTFKEFVKKVMNGTAKEPEGNWAKFAKNSGNTKWMQTVLAHTIVCWKDVSSEGTSVDFDAVKKGFECSIEELKVTPKEHRRRAASVLRLLFEGYCNSQSPLDIKKMGFVAVLFSLACEVGNPDSNLNKAVEFVEGAIAKAAADSKEKVAADSKEKVKEKGPLYTLWRKTIADLKQDVDDDIFAAIVDDMKNCVGKPLEELMTCASQKLSSRLFTTEAKKKFVAKAAVKFCKR